MSWLYSRALVEVFSEATCSVGELFVLSSAIPTPQAFCAPDRMTDFFRPSRFGMTFRPLTVDRGEELLMWYLGDFLAKTSALPEPEKDLTASEADYGRKWRGSWAKYYPDSCSWKTAQCSLLEGLDEFLETWPRSGLMRHGECYPLRTVVRPTAESAFGSSLIPTPTTQDNNQVAGMYANPKSTTTLGGWVRLWPTPVADDTGQRSKKYAQGGTPLSMAVRMWATPTVQDAKNNGAASQHKRNTKPLNAEVGGHLNPPWVEWLMGWPLEWTALKPLETDRFQSWRQQHFAN
jgi:hypothetical protein